MRVRPRPPHDEARLRVIDDAVLTAFADAPLHLPVAPRTATYGAVYDDGVLVEDTLRMGGVTGDQVAAADPTTLPDDVADRVRAGEIERLAGTWIYVGPWMTQFGHFLLETLTTLWPERSDLPGDLEGIVCHPFIGHGMKGFHHRLLDLAGYGGLPRVVVDAQPMVVEHLIAPSRTLAINAWGLPEAAQAWQRIAAETAARYPKSRTGATRVFLSRSRYDAAEAEAGREPRVPLEWSQTLDALVARHGFLVVHPQELPIEEQVLAVADAEFVAGLPGSHLHLSVFAPPTARLIELGDARARAAALPSQHVVDATAGHQVAYLPYSTDTVEIDRMLRALLAD